MGPRRAARARRRISPTDCRPPRKRTLRKTHRVLLLARDGSGGGEHEAQDGEVALLLLDDALERLDVERNGEAVDREHNRVPPRVDHDLCPHQKLVSSPSNPTLEKKENGSHLLHPDRLRQLIVPHIALKPPPRLLAVPLPSSAFLTEPLEPLVVPAGGQVLLVLLAAVESVGVNLAVLASEGRLDDGRRRGGFARGGLARVVGFRVGLGGPLDFLLRGRVGRVSERATEGGKGRRTSMKNMTESLDFIPSERISELDLPTLTVSMREIA